MTIIKLGYDKTKKYKWITLDKDYSKKEYNGKLVVEINEMLWGKVKNIMFLREKGYDAVLLVDGRRRSGKSTLAKSIAYLLSPDLTIDNYVAGLEEAPEKLDKAKEESSLIFDEGSLVASSKDGMAKKNKQLEKIIDVIGQKRLCLIFCMPEFFKISRPIAVVHSLFLIHVYTDDKMNRGRFAYFGTKKKKTLYELGKKNHGSYARPKSDFTGMFNDFHLPFEDEYLKLKKESLREALDPEYKKEKKLNESQLFSKFIYTFRQNYPQLKLKELAVGVGISSRQVSERLANHKKLLAEIEEGKKK